MKKSIFILTALFAATFASAQITLEHTYNSYLYLPNDIGFASTFPLCYGDVYGLFDASYDVIIMDAYNHEELGKFQWTTPFIAARNLFTTDNSLVVLTIKDENLVLITADFTIIQNLGAKAVCEDCSSSKIIQLPDGSFKLILRIREQEGSKTEVYSLPGKGVPTEISSPVPQRSSARKIAREGQVLVETENNTYTLQGQEIK